MNVLLVLAHPLTDSLSAHLADHAATALRIQGHEVRVADLYREGFDPVLTAEERRTYGENTAPDSAGLQAAEAIVFVFPTWWFGLPAILKGWIDRSFRPGAAFDAGGGAMVPRLTGLRRVLVITTLGSPAWIDWLVLRRPVSRVLRWGVFRPCAPHARVRTLSLYGAEQVTPARLARFLARIDHEIGRGFRT